MVIIETAVFSRLIQEMMDDDDYRLLQEALVIRPEMGDFIKGSGGLRKVRWKRKGQKRWCPHHLLLGYGRRPNLDALCLWKMPSGKFNIGTTDYDESDGKEVVS